MNKGGATMILNNHIKTERRREERVWLVGTAIGQHDMRRERESKKKRGRGGM